MTIKFSSMFNVLALLIVVPLIIIILAYFLFMRYEKKNKDKSVYLFKRDFWSSIISVVYGSIFFSLSLGYAVNVFSKIYEYSLQDKYLWILIGVSILVAFTFILFIHLFIKYLKVIKNKDNYFKEEEENYVS